MDTQRASPAMTIQRGAVLMVMLVILIMGVTTVLISSLSSTAMMSARQEKTALVLAQAKEALIGYAISSEFISAASSARPGNFPCPDINNNGNEGGSCSSGGGTTIGRLPWKSLGLSELFDGDGETLWYVVSDNFRRHSNPASNPLNSDTMGTLKVFDQDGVSDLTPEGSEAVAIIFAPGKVVASQQRNDAAQRIDATNYLDAASGVNNATLGPFIAAAKSDTFNDSLVIIRTRDFMPTIEKRIGKALKTILTNYQDANAGVYPYPSSCDGSTSTSCDSDVSACLGRLPSIALPVDWPVNALPSTSTSNWFVDNKWYRVIYYTIGSPTCGPLDISGNSADALFFMPGTPLAGALRSYPNTDPATPYLEDAENLNMDNNYVTPTASSNDQLYVLP